eukprot:scaffold5441_cov213-Pinguiococcus_pyrenoidosus.AAC.1
MAEDAPVRDFSAVSLPGEGQNHLQRGSLFSGPISLGSSLSRNGHFVRTSVNVHSTVILRAPRMVFSQRRMPLGFLCCLSISAVLEGRVRKQSLVLRLA